MFAVPQGTAEPRLGITALTGQNFEPLHDAEHKRNPSFDIPNEFAHKEMTIVNTVYGTESHIDNVLSFYFSKRLNEVLFGDVTALKLQN